MSRKTRNLIWSVPLIAAVAVIGALALFLTLEPNGAAAQSLNLPGQPTDLTAGPYADGIPQEQIEISWKEPTDGGAVSSYRVDFSEDGNVWRALPGAESLTAPRFVHGSLMAEETRHYRVFAVNNNGSSRMAGPASGMTAASRVPDEVTDLDLNTPVPGKDRITLEWTAPAKPPGAPITAYRIEHSENGSSGWTQLVEFKVSDASSNTALMIVTTGGVQTITYEDRKLLESTTWYYRVYAMNSVRFKRRFRCAQREDRRGRALLAHRAICSRE